MDDIVGSCQSAATSVIVKALLVTSLTQISKCYIKYLTFTFITPPPVGGWGIVFWRFLCFFVSNITRKRLDRFT